MEKKITITIVLTEQGASYTVVPEGHTIPTNFPLTGTREVRKAKGIVTRVVYGFGFVTRATGQADE